ncbi:MAG TPA: V-type ATP synthase subunit F [Thermoplasmata archaeon]|nr:V-type ATP synthase subunit F [Thermoplasmata archaeon]
MAGAPAGAGRTIVLGERELVIGFRLIGLKDTVEVTPATAASQFDQAMKAPDVSLVIASQSIRGSLTENARAAADASLRPLVVFVPTPTGEYEVESIQALAKRVLGVSLALPG